jgi:hypothetical protein
MDMQLAAQANRLRASGQQPMLMPPTPQYQEQGLNPYAGLSILSAVPEDLSHLMPARPEDLQSYISGAPSELALDAVSESVFLMP